jgi:hypothetical protein
MIRMDESLAGNGHEAGDSGGQAYRVGGKAATIFRPGSVGNAARCELGIDPPSASADDEPKGPPGRQHGDHQEVGP